MEPASLSRTDVHLRAWPLVFANAAIPLAAAVDTFVLGLSGNASELGGVALGGTVFSVFYWSFYFLRMGTTGLTAQADGAQRHNSLIRILVRALLIGTLLRLYYRLPISDHMIGVLHRIDSLAHKRCQY